MVGTLLAAAIMAIAGARRPPLAPSRLSR